VPARTLQRHLQQQGTSFSSELDRARRELAFQRVTSTRTPFAAVAKELGLADATVFSRSFRRWYGDTPGALRRLYQKVARARD
jgi:AraC-like DNA-binding protein